MSSWLAPALLPAALVMVAFALIPRRYWYIQLPAVLGWAIVWADNHLTWHWTDLTGLAVISLAAASSILLRPPAAIPPTETPV